VANPQILILDETTASIDTYTELLIQEALKELLRDRTALVIAHRLSTIRNADRIVLSTKVALLYRVLTINSWHPVDTIPGSRTTQLTGHSVRDLRKMTKAAAELTDKHMIIRRVRDEVYFCTPGRSAKVKLIRLGGEEDHRDDFKALQHPGGTA